MKNYKNFKNKNVLITGHNGFKGTWLCVWLSLLGANIIGISLKNKTKRYNHYNLVKNKIKVKNYYFDIRNFNKFNKVIIKEKPDYIFHLAAQSLVYKSIINPMFNWETNVIGLLNLLNSIKKLKKKCTIVIVTSDKCYKNLEINKGYKETDILGGVDPYSASKASAEILFHSFFETFLKNKKNIRICSARAGNVIGGGDWSDKRLIPDCMKMWLYKKKPVIRSPRSTRPWQHVLEAVNGYLTLSSTLNYNSKINGHSFNFSSDKIKNLTVIKFLKEIKSIWPDIKWLVKENKSFYESSLLQLNNNKAKKLLKWKAKLNFKETIEYLVSWYKEYNINKRGILKITEEQIKKFNKK